MFSSRETLCGLPEVKPMIFNGVPRDTVNRWHKLFPLTQKEAHRFGKILRKIILEICNNKITFTNCRHRRRFAVLS